MLFSRTDVVSTGQALGKQWPGLSLWIHCWLIKVRGENYFLKKKNLSIQFKNVVVRGQVSKLQTQYDFWPVHKGLLRKQKGSERVLFYEDNGC